MNRIFYRISPEIINFVATTFLAGVWAQTGFMAWKKLPWYCALLLWVLYLTPVCIGYYIAAQINKFKQEVYLKAMAEVPHGASLVDIRRKEQEIFNAIIQLNPEYRRVGIMGLFFAVLVVVDIIITIILYAKGII